MDGNRWGTPFLNGSLAALSPRRKTLVCVLMVFAVLALHVGLRWRANDRRQAAELHALYPHCYSRSISLLVGRGYERLPLADDAASKPVKQFLDIETLTLSAEALQKYLASLPEQKNPDLGNYRQIDLLRAGDLYTAAIVWKLCGVSWLALNRFYILISALACLAIFFAAKKISGSFAAGLTAALLYAACPYENTLVVRDTNPMWFIAFATLALTNVNGRQSKWAGLLGGLLLGIASVLGYGWRPQLLFFAPFFLAAALIRSAFDGASPRHLVIMTVAFLLGASAVAAGFRSLNNSPSDALMTAGFHVAYFGEQYRAAGAGAENDLQISYDDSKVASDVNTYCAALGLETPKAYDAVYSETCKTFYFEAMKHHLYYWVRSAPTMIHAAVSGKRLNGKSNTWQRIAPWLFVVGLLSFATRHVDRIAVALMLAILGFYFGIWFGISPEPRHWGVFLVPVCIIGGLAPTVIVAGLQKWRTGEWRQAHCKSQLRYLFVALTACIALWIGACAVAYGISSQARAAYWAAIQAGVEKAAPIVDDRLTPQSFVVTFPESDVAFSRGYYIEIQAGANPQDLLCKHLRTSSNPVEPFADWKGNPPGSGMLDRVREALWWNTFMETRHRLIPNKNQVFFVTGSREPSGGDKRSYSLKITMSGDAKITAVREFNLADWRFLPISSVFQLDDPGVTPFVDAPSTRTLSQFSATPKTLAELGFPESTSVSLSPP